MPTQEQIDVFARWNDAAGRGERASDRTRSMAERLEEAARLSATAAELHDGVEAAEPDGRRV
jgi:hypothetical protein